MRSLLTCALILAAYCAAVSSGLVPASDGITIWQSNTVKAERFLFHNASESRILVVGSSLANNIRAEWIGPDVTNLAMSGGSSQTGLLIALRASTRPETVLVEVNETLARSTDEDLVRALFGGWGTLRRRVPALREEYNPVSVLVSLVKHRIRREQPPSPSERDVALISPVRRTVIQQVLKQQALGLSEADRKSILSGAKRLRAEIATFQSRGVRVVLFDIPGERSVRESLRQRQIAALLKDAFPASEYSWLPEPPERNWVTSDGGHLVRPDALAFGHYLRQQIHSAFESAGR
ncbi:MAG: hypothetical protein IT209_09060 [Armatimonadetes bacterium]|nr:hypothetical protein [Armatimonadota bacterium]